MSVPISEFVDVSIAIAPTPQGLSGFGQLLCLSRDAADGVAPIDAEERIRYYSSMTAVAADFPDVDNEVNKAATSYYAQTPRPRDFLVGLIAGQLSAAKLTGVAPVTQPTLQAITNGGMTLLIDASNVVLTGVNLSTATTYALVATAIQSALQASRPGSTCTYTDNKFVITSGTTGLESHIGGATAESGGLATGLGVLATQNPVVVQGSDADSPAYAATQCEQTNNSFYGVVIGSEYADSQDVLDMADWVEARPKVFFNTTNDAVVLTAANTTTITAQLQGKSLKKTLSIYSPTVGDFAGASVAGRAFTVNFEGTNTTITLMYKKLPTINVANLNPTQRANMDRINCNAFLNVSGNSFFAESKMADGGYFDTVHGLAWLQNRIETDVFNLLYTSNTKVPYDDTGVTMIVAKVDQGLRQGVRNGLIAPGTTTDGTYLEQGYVINYVPVREVSSADKGNRIYKGVSFIAVGAGAIHGVVITGSFSE
jgi:hypothetical protein